MAPTPILVTGVPSTTGPTPERKEVRELQKDSEMFELFLLGMRSYQQQNATEPTSYWSVSSKLASFPVELM